MSGSHDARDRLRAAKPLRYEHTPTSDSPQAEALLQRIIATDPTDQGRRRTAKRRVAWVLVPLALVTAAAGYGLLYKVTQPLVVVCYEQPALGAPRTVVSASRDDPGAACGSLWLAGGEFNGQGSKPIPRLAACLLGSGAVGVFPATSRADTCTTLGLVPAVGPAQNEQEIKAVQDVQALLSAEFLSRCVAGDEAMSMVKRELARHGLVDWKVEVSRRFSALEPCASLVVDDPGRMITLIPVRDPSST
jgi:hypothetical protein